MGLFKSKPAPVIPAAQPVTSELLDGQIEKSLEAFKSMAQSLLGVASKAHAEKTVKEEQIKTLQIEAENLDKTKTRAEQMATKLNDFFS